MTEAKSPRTAVKWDIASTEFEEGCWEYYVMSALPFYYFLNEEQALSKYNQPESSMGYFPRTFVIMDLISL